MGLKLIDNHDPQVGLAVLFTNEVLCHRGIFSPLVHDVETMVVHPDVEWLTSLAHILQTTPPAHD